MMKVDGKVLFNYENLENYVDKFGDKIKEAQARIEQLKKDIELLDMEADELMELDILSDGNEYGKQLTNTTAKRANLQAQLENEVNKLTKISEIMSEGLQKIIPETANQIQADMNTYNNLVERELYRQLQDVRQAQERLLLTLEASHNAVIIGTQEFDEYCTFANMKEYRKQYSHNLFHNNLFMPHRSFPELGSPLLDCSFLPLTEDVIMRSRAEANAIYNRHEDKGQLPLNLRITDIDLQAFLNSINTDSNDKGDE